VTRKIDFLDVLTSWEGGMMMMMVVVMMPFLLLGEALGWACKTYIFGWVRSPSGRWNIEFDIYSSLNQDQGTQHPQLHTKSTQLNSTIIIIHHGFRTLLRSYPLLGLGLWCCS
jgi:hypothetical protein